MNPELEKDNFIDEMDKSSSNINQNFDDEDSDINRKTLKLDEKEYKKAGIFKQIVLLVKKNFKVILGRPGFMFSHLFTTVLVCGVILLINFLTRFSYENEPSMIYDPTTVGNIQKCTFSENCKSLGYIIIGENAKWTDYTIEHMANKSGLDPQNDFQKIYQGNNVTEALSQIKGKDNSEYSAIVLLCTSVIQIFTFQFDCSRMESSYTYWLLYNQSLVKQNFLDNLNAPLKMSIDALRAARQVENAISNFILLDGGYSDTPQVEHNYTFQDYPKVQSRVFSDFDTSSQQGTFWFFIPIMISFLSFNTELLKEKEKKLRQGLMLFGISSLSYLASWTIFMLIFNMFFTTFLVGLAYVCQFSVFVNTPLYMLWMCFYALVCGFNSLSMFMCSLVSDNKSGSKFGYGLMLFSLFLQIFFGQGALLRFMYVKDDNWIANAFRWLLYTNPSFHFCNAFQNIIAKAGNKFDRSSALWVKGSEYLWDDFTRDIEGEIFGNSFTRPSPLKSLGTIMLVTAFYYILVFIFDNTVASNRGFSRNPFMVLFNSCCRRRKDTKKVENQLGDNESVTLGEGAMSVNDSALERNGIILRNISKSYLIKCKRKGKARDWALRFVDLKIKKGELFGLLGPNGAGKTTMIGLLSGILDPTEGEFYSCGLNGKYDSGQIRKFTNVCPQFDILWAELTIYDHIKMILDIKGLKNLPYREFAIELMDAVNLVESLDERISSLSGGMRRRVSIALATIGNPKILIFDEPTTGLDPENRQDIWGFINKLKQKGRTIMLTTHILEEADILSDRICIMNYGRVKITGTSAELKRKVGAGFKLNIILKDYTQEKIDKITEFVTQTATSASLLDSSGGALLFVIPFTATSEITKLLKEYEGREDLEDLVDDLAVSNSTLEEVFIEVTKEDEDIVEEIDLIGKEDVDLD